MTNQTTGLMAAGAPTTVQPPEKVKYVLYARKSTEQDEKQALSIESQVKEMLRIAERDSLEIVDIRREAHSAKDSGTRPVFNDIIHDLRSGRYTGILTWAADRLSRNAGDLGSLVDLMDQKLLIEIRTYTQNFKNSPNEKFLLMILCSQAKLENDNKSENVKRGLRTRCEMGLWPSSTPTGYLSEKRLDRKCQLLVDPERSPVIRQMFEKIGNEQWSGVKLYHWLKFDLNFKTKNGKHLSIGNIYTILENTFYYGVFEYPRKSGNWYTGAHKPLITRELYEKTRERVTRDKFTRGEAKEWAFTNLISCGLCGSGITAMEKFKKLKGGGANRHVYYLCSRSKDRHCKNPYIKEDDVLHQLVGIMDTIDLNELAIKEKLRDEIERHRSFNKNILGIREEEDETKDQEFNLRAYAKHILKSGTLLEKREILESLKSKLVLKDKELTFAK